MRVFLYGRPAVFALAAAASLIEKTGHTAQYRRDGLFTADQTEPCDAVVVQLGLDTTAPIVEAYGAKEVPIFGVPVNEHFPAVIRSGGFAGLAAFLGYDLAPVLEEMDAAERQAAGQDEASRAQLAAAAAQLAADEAAAGSGSEPAPDAAVAGSIAPSVDATISDPPSDDPRATGPSDPAPDAGTSASSPAPDAAPASGSRRRGGGR